MRWHGLRAWPPRLQCLAAAVTLCSCLCPDGAVVAVVLSVTVRVCFLSSPCPLPAMSLSASCLSLSRSLSSVSMWKVHKPGSQEA